MPANRFYELAEYFELLQTQLRNAKGTDQAASRFRREILRRMNQTLNAMHEEHRLWLAGISGRTADSRAEKATPARGTSTAA